MTETKRKIKDIKKEMSFDNYSFVRLQKGYFKEDGKEVIRPVLFFKHKYRSGLYGSIELKYKIVE
jgi:hypothetical protein